MNTNEEQQIKWDLRFLNLASHVSTWSKDPSTQVGAVITDFKEIVAVGYNGFPEDVDDRPEWYEDRDTKLGLMVHGEINAKRFAEKAGRDLTGCTLYTYPFLPCKPCAIKYLNSGIIRVVSLKNTVERWEESIQGSIDEFIKAGIVVDDSYILNVPEGFDESLGNIERLT